MRRIPPLAAAVLVMVLAACGGSSTTPYTAAGTKACLVKQGFTGVTTDPAKIGFIAAFAQNGGLLAKSKTGNVVTIAFAADATGATQTESEFKRHAPVGLRPHMADIMESQRNAVLVWTVSPTQTEISAAEGCLSP